MPELMHLRKRGHPVLSLNGPHRQATNVSIAISLTYFFLIAVVCQRGREYTEIKKK